MKANLFLAVIIFVICGLNYNTNAQIVNIPDANFKAALVGNLSINTNADSEIDSSEAAAFSDTINVGYFYSISDLTGIEAFTSLTALKCPGNILSGLNLSANTALTYLDCNSNQLTSINISANSLLTSLICSFNLLTSIDISANTALTNVDCGNNLLTSLNTSANTSLVSLICNNNQITGLDIAANTALTSLLCNNNELTSLDISANTAIEYLYCNSNQLTSLDLSANTALIYLDCNNNLLTSLNLSTNTAINTLYCFLNQITNLELSSNTALAILYCSSNQITGLDLSGNTALSILYCSDNQLTSLNIKNGNNTNFYDFNTTNNPGLSCIQVDNAAYMNTNWAGAKDITASYSEDCCIVNIPDANFKNYLVNNLSINTNSDSEIQCSEAVAFAGSITVPNLSISDLTGIEAFAAIYWLDCQNNLLTGNLNVSTNTSLTNLYCNNNQLTSLDLSANTVLGELICSFNQLTNLDLSATSTALNLLECEGNQLTSLNFSANTDIEVIYCSNNQLTSLNLSSNTALVELQCNNNQLTSLNITNGNNINLQTFDATLNSNLICIQVDSVEYMNTNWAGAKDVTATYSEDCTPCTPTSSSQTFVECAGFSVTVDSNTYDTTGVYTDTLTGSNGCDSTVTTNLTINSVFNETATATICNGSDYIFGTQTLSTAGDYIETFASELGCDSVVTLTLSVNPELVVNLGADSTLLCINYYYVDTLDAENTGASYLWSDNSANQTLLVDASLLTVGVYTYSVTVTDGICTSIDSIVVVADICAGISSNDNNMNILIYPNPTEGKLNISFEGSNSNATLSIIDVSGKEIYNENIISGTELKVIDLGKFPKGIYSVKVLTDTNVKIERIVLQ